MPSGNLSGFIDARRVGSIYINFVAPLPGLGGPVQCLHAFRHFPVGSLQ